MRPAILLLLASAVFAQNPFNEKPSYARSRDFDLQHLKLELAFDLPARKVLGTATLRFAPLSGDLREVTLDSSGLQIDSVTVAGRPIQFRTADNQLVLAMDRQYAAGAPVEVAIRYQAQPKRGLFFILPDDHHPNRPRQIWANGDTAGGNNRYWFPLYDFPNDKATTEMLVTVPAGWEVLSNGKLVGTTGTGGAGARTFHWLQDQPMSTYLISLVAGEFDKRSANWKVPVEYYVPRGRAGDISRTFDRTIPMLEFFSANIAPYPWAKYAQAAVDTFGGGMENTSATTLGANTLMEEREFEDRRAGVDGLISHEMVHQWFGDLVTCTDWRHAWLNEGFATYFAALWLEHADGRDAFDWNELRAARGIVNSGLRYSVVPQNGQDENAYGFIYNKGGWTVHMVREQLGDPRFWKAIQHYTKKFSYRNATTSDFVEAIAESTGQDLEWLFDQYVYKPGHPAFDVSWNYDDKGQSLRVSVKQTQQVDGKPAPFRVPIELEALGDGGTESLRIFVSKESEDFQFHLQARPRTVLFDPRDVILKRLTFHKPAAEWIWQLEHSARALNRVEAAAALGAMTEPEVVPALARAGTADRFYGVRIDASASLGRIKGSAARAALLQMLNDSDSQVRSAAAGELGRMERDASTIARLLEVAGRDTSFAVRQSALVSAGRLKPDKAVEILKPFLRMDSPHQQMRAAAIQAMELAGDNAAFPTVLELSHDTEDRVRQSALSALGNLGKSNDTVRDRLIQALQDPDKTDRIIAISALRQRRDIAAIGPLEKLVQNEGLPNIVRAARGAIEILRAEPGEAAQLKSRITQLEKENAELKSRLDRLEKPKN